MFLHIRFSKCVLTAFDLRLSRVSSNLREHFPLFHLRLNQRTPEYGDACLCGNECACIIFTIIGLSYMCVTVSTKDSLIFIAVSLLKRERHAIEFTSSILPEMNGSKVSKRYKPSMIIRGKSGVLYHYSCSFLGWLAVFTHSIKHREKDLLNALAGREREIQ